MKTVDTTTTLTNAGGEINKIEREDPSPPGMIPPQDCTAEGGMIFLRFDRHSNRLWFLGRDGALFSFLELCI